MHPFFYLYDTKMNYLIIKYPARHTVSMFVAAALMSACVSLPPQDAAPQSKEVSASDFARAGSAHWPAWNWWKQFNDPQLDGLIEQALKNSPGIEVAVARGKQASASVTAVAASSGAQLAAVGQVSRQLYSENSFYPPPLAGSYSNSGNVDLQFSYNFDFWGRNRSALQAALGRQAASTAEIEAASLALSNSIVKVYFQWQALNAQIAIMNQVETERRSLVALEQKKIAAGISAGDNVQSLIADAIIPQQNSIQLKTQQEQARYQLKSLTGIQGELTLTPAPLPAATDVTPADVHVDLLVRRPDVAAARDRVTASLHEVDSARAGFYPDVSISAFLGLNSLQLSSLLHAGSREQGITPAIHLPIFDAGRLRANLEDSRADVAYAVAQYDATLQSSIAEVNDAMVRFDGINREHPKLLEQIAARTRNLESAKKRAKAGLAEKRELVNDELSVLELQAQELQWQTQMLTAQVDLIKALGGGYNKPPTVQ